MRAGQAGSEGQMGGVLSGRPGTRARIRIRVYDELSGEHTRWYLRGGRPFRIRF